MKTQPKGTETLFQEKAAKINQQFLSWKYSQTHPKAHVTKTHTRRTETPFPESETKKHKHRFSRKCNQNKVNIYLI
jgi:hypothetical protein